MKIKVIIFLSVVLGLVNLQGQSVIDTSAYLKDSIIQKKSYYIGKPLKILLADLKINVVYSLTVPRWDKKLKDTISLSEITLEFYTLDDRLNRLDLGIKSSSIEIKFAQPIPIPKKWFMRGEIFEKDDWDFRKQRFFRNCIIGEIDLRGI